MAKEKTGLKWQYKITESSLSPNPKILGQYNNLIYFYVENLLIALDTKTSKEVWRFNTSAENPSNIIILDEILYFGTDEFFMRDSGKPEQPNYFYALDPMTGEVKWESIKQTDKDSGVNCLTKVGKYFIYTPHRYLYTVDIETKETKSVFKSSSLIRNITVVDENLYLTTESGLILMDVNLAIKGFPHSKKWVFETGDSISSSSAVSDGTAYFGISDKNLYAVDIKTGEEKWKFKVGDNIYSSPTVADGVVYFSSGSSMHALEKNGVQKWKFDLPLGRISSHQSIDNTLYFSCKNILYALDAKTGEEKWKYTGSHTSTATPLILKGKVYWPCGIYIYAIDILIAEKMAPQRKKEEIKQIEQRKEEEIKKKEAEQERIRKIASEKRSHWKSDTEENLKKIRDLMVSTQFDAGIELALTVDDPYLLLELVEGCKIGEDGTITLNETFADNASEESYNLLAGALFKMIITINDIQKPESSLKLENIKVLNLYPFVKLPSNIDAFTNLETVLITPKHSKSIPKEYSTIDGLQIKTALSAEEIVQAIWNTYGQPYDKNTPKSSILNYNYETEVKHIEADYISSDGLGCKRLDDYNCGSDCHFFDKESDEYNPKKMEKMENIEITVWDYIVGNFESDFNSKVNASTLTGELNLGLQSKEAIEEILNNMMDDLCEIFRGFTVMGGEVLYPEQGDNPWEHPETIYLEVYAPKVSLEDINPDWIEDEYTLVD
jgi:outer membrane protein assembly factor BamB